MENQFDYSQITSSAPMDCNNLTISSTCGIGSSGRALETNSIGASIGAWTYWSEYYYPNVIHCSYPVYIRERALDKGKQAFEIIKILKDKKLVKIERVSQFIDLMDELIKIL